MIDKLCRVYDFVVLPVLMLMLMMLAMTFLLQLLMMTVEVFKGDSITAGDSLRIETVTKRVEEGK